MKQINFDEYAPFSHHSPLPRQNPVEPMQVDVPEDNENIEDATYTVDNPSLDLEVYANSYTGFSRLHRLIYIADHCPSLRFEALKMAIQYVTTTYNVSLYQTLHKKVANMNNNAGSVTPLPDVASQSTAQVSRIIHRFMFLEITKISFPTGRHPSLRCHLDRNEKQEGRSETRETR